ncbi:MAG TPA: hypothetical protein VK988_21105, partial [Acidimicrobiales bacterium]|nr:hypothetical protein [Acidimicrobiales bacterium]
DLAQRDGRALRQGNANAEVAMLRYVTEESFDVFMWQTCERKAAFIHQVMAGDVAGREVDDVGDVALSYAEVKALATGNPLILEMAGVDNDVARLGRLRQAHDRDQTALARTVVTCDTRAGQLDQRIVAAEAALARRRDTAGDRFAMRIDGVLHAKRSEAGAQLHRRLSDIAERCGGGGVVAAAPVAELGGFTVEAGGGGGDADVIVTVADAPVEALRLSREELAGADPAGLIARLEHRLRSLDDALATARQELERTTAEAAAARARLGAPFPQEERLAALRRRQAEIERALTPVEPEPAATEASPATSALVAKAYPTGPPVPAGAGPVLGNGETTRLRGPRAPSHPRSR